MIDVGESNFVPAPATCVRSSVVSGDTVVRRNETLRYNVVPILHYTPRAPIIPPRVVRLRHQLRKHGGTWCRDTYTVSIQLADCPACRYDPTAPAASPRNRAPCCFFRDHAVPSPRR